MSEVKTFKQEVLDLLALDELPHDQKDRLDWLTMKQAGIYLEDFHKSVDACLMLPLPPRHGWILGVFEDKRSARILHRDTDVPAATEFADRLPQAMLKAWWSTQPHN